MKEGKSRQRPAWHGGRRAGEPLRERRPYNSRRAIARGKTEWFLRTDNVFFWSGEWRELSMAGRSILDVLRHLADGDDPYRWLYVSDRDIMHYAGISRPTVIAALCDLQEHGCIEGERGGRQAARYRLTEKVLRFSHGRRKKTRRQPRAAKARPAKPKPAKLKAAKPDADEKFPDFSQVPKDLAAAIKPSHLSTCPPHIWRGVIRGHSPQHVRDTLTVYRSQAELEPIRNPLALFNGLLGANWVAARAAEIAEEKHEAAAAEDRHQAKKQKDREERERIEELAKRHSREFTQEELDTYSDVAQAEVQSHKFQRPEWKKPGSGMWKIHMWALIDQAEKDAQAAQEAPGSTPTENETNGAAPAAEAAGTGH